MPTPLPRRQTITKDSSSAQRNFRAQVRAAKATRKQLRCVCSSPRGRHRLAQHDSRLRVDSGLESGIVCFTITPALHRLQRLACRKRAQPNLWMLEKQGDRRPFASQNRSRFQILGIPEAGEKAGSSRLPNIPSILSANPTLRTNQSLGSRQSDRAQAPPGGPIGATGRPRLRTQQKIASTMISGTPVGGRRPSPSLFFPE